MKIYKSKWILPGNGKIIENSAIVVEKHKIIDILDSFDLAQIESIEIIDYENAIITPGFINLHTHLQFTELKKKSSLSNFSEWIIELMSQYSGWNISQKNNSFKQGLKESLLSGTTCIAQISGEEEFFDIVNTLNIRSYIFLESFSNSGETSLIEFKKLKDKFNRLSQEKSSNIEIGFSPHSVYNVHPVLWKKIAEYSFENNILVQTHLAESQAEMDWLKNGCSDIDLIHKFVGWNKVTPFETGLNPVQYLSKLGILDFLGKNLITAHLNQLKSKFLNELAQNGANIVHCPRSNIFLHKKTLNINETKNFEHIGVGTDSKFSNNDLNMLHEAKFIKDNTELELLTLLDMLTINSAKILRLDDKIGSLEKNKDADFLVFKLSQNESYTDLFEKDRPDHVYIQGKPVK